jgi:hypothetical protein
MIDAKELRIGNLIAAEGINHFKIDELILSERGEYISRMYIPTEPFRSNVDLSLRMAAGIPLTEEILQKCGFEKEEDGDLYYNEKNGWKNDVCFLRRGHVFSLYICAHDDYYSYNGIKIKSVHQLQNLWFALMGEELEITLLLSIH